MKSFIEGGGGCIAGYKPGDTQFPSVIMCHRHTQQCRVTSVAVASLLLHHPPTPSLQHNATKNLPWLTRLTAAWASHSGKLAGKTPQRSGTSAANNDTA